MSIESTARDIFGITEKDLLPGETLEEAMERVLKQTKEVSNELEGLIGGEEKEE